MIGEFFRGGAETREGVDDEAIEPIVGDRLETLERDSGLVVTLILPTDITVLLVRVKSSEAPRIATRVDKSLSPFHHAKKLRTTVV